MDRGGRAFFTSRVWRSVIKRPLFQPRDDDPVLRANRFIVVTAGGYLGAGICAAIAAVVGEGQGGSTWRPAS